MMINPFLKRALLFVVVLAQIIVPLGMIVRREWTLRTGARFLFQTQAVDPYDAFRGRYVALNILAAQFSLAEGKAFEHYQSIFVLLQVGSDGFAKIADVASERPLGTDYIQAKAGYMMDDKLRKLCIEFPFDRYYMDENDAPEAEKIYQQHNAGDKRDAYISVRVKSGFAVLEELYIGGRPIRDFMREKRH